LPAFDLAPNENHRLRFLNVGVFAWFEVSLDEHSLAVTEVDGTDVEPLIIQQLHIGPGQRYSTIITTNQTSGESFWLRARMITHCFSDPDLPGPGADAVNAIVSYSEKDKSSEYPIPHPMSQNRDTEFTVQCRDMNHREFISVPAITTSATADHSYYIRSNLEIGDWRLERGFFNTSTFRPNLPFPSLHRTLEGLQSTNSTFSTMKNGVNDAAFHLKNELVIQHSGIQTIDLIIQNFDEGNHPLHLHGHKFFVLGQGHGYFPGYSDDSSVRLSNPLRRDTATVEGFGWLLLRFIADNPGVWAFHCHMAWHSEAGMLMQFLNRPEIMVGWELPALHRQLCEIDTAELEKGAAPKDEIWYGFGIGK
jgi:FtsP/CotA-like multicopper oxidase with cupredoxin domain